MTIDDLVKRLLEIRSTFGNIDVQNIQKVEILGRMDVNMKKIRVVNLSWD